MKTEISVTAPATGTIRDLRAAPGATLQAGQILAVLQES